MNIYSYNIGARFLNRMTKVIRLYIPVTIASFPGVLQTYRNCLDQFLRPLDIRYGSVYVAFAQMLDTTVARSQNLLYCRQEHELTT